MIKNYPGPIIRWRDANTNHTVLMSLCHYGYGKLADNLLKAADNLDPKLKNGLLNQRNTMSLTALDYASMAPSDKMLATAAVLRKHGADVTLMKTPEGEVDDITTLAEPFVVAMAPECKTTSAYDSRNTATLKRAGALLELACVDRKVYFSVFYLMPSLFSSFVFMEPSPCCNCRPFHLSTRPYGKVCSGLDSCASHFPPPCKPSNPGPWQLPHRWSHCPLALITYKVAAPLEIIHSHRIT